MLQFQETKKNKSNRLNSPVARLLLVAFSDNSAKVHCCDGHALAVINILTLRINQRNRILRSSVINILLHFYSVFKSHTSVYTVKHLDAGHTIIFANSVRVSDLGNTQTQL